MLMPSTDTKKKASTPKKKAAAKTTKAKNQPSSVKDGQNGIVRPKVDKILFSIPDFFFLFDLNMILIQLMEKERNKFYDDVKIDSVYGSFPGCMWNSGRASVGWTPVENMISTTKAYNELGVSVRHTFTNSMITGRHYYDHYCNTVLQNCASAVRGIDNGVNVNAPGLADYIAQNYPEYYLIWSTTKGVNDVKETNKLSEDRLTVLYYGMNNTKALKDLTHPENIEILVSEACIERCPKRFDHYESINKAQLMIPQGEPFTCPYGCEGYFYYDVPVIRDHYVTIDDIREVYMPLGINKFKISGRNDSPVNVIENYVNYLVKPEFRDNIRNKLLIMYLQRR